MAIARKCDRCGKFYEDSSTRKHYINAFIYQGILMGDRMIDLCDECSAQLKAFISNPSIVIDIPKEEEVDG